MREIKFRGLRTYDKGWVYGDLLCNWTVPQILSEDDGNEYLVIPESVSQFTGILDKNGKEIYEGDLLIDREFDELGNDISGHYPVIYSEKTAQFCIDNSFKKDGSHIVSIVTYFGIEGLEVIGNIYEGKEDNNERH